jgi:hypothetical protein
LTPITVSIGDLVLHARLHDNSPSRGLLAQLPLTLQFKDFNAVEKVATLPRALDLSGMPAGADPDVGHIGYWAPTRHLVLYYGDVGFWNGISILGEFDDSTRPLAEMTKGFTATIQAA